jgi:hypothetical protein
MPRGGARKGAGRPRGSLTKKNQEIVAGAAAAGELPLEYMLRLMRAEESPASLRVAMAVAAAPYLHPKLAATLVKEQKEDLEVVIVRFETVYEDGTKTISSVPPDKRPPMKTIEHERS